MLVDRNKTFIDQCGIIGVFKISAKEKKKKRITKYNTFHLKFILKIRKFHFGISHFFVFALFLIFGVKDISTN